MTDTAADVVLRLRGITKRFGALTACDHVSFELKRGEMVALLGENGAGKTTLMNILFGQYLAEEGTIEAFGASLPAGDSRAALDAGLAMVHQHFTLAENMSVVENIAIGAQPILAPVLHRGRIEARLRDLMTRFGLHVPPHARIADLSVGEKQRVEILKALYSDARILILDEPTAVLTPQESDQLFTTLRQLADDGLSVIFISHKLKEVMGASDRVLVLRHGALVGEVATAQTSAPELAEMMVGARLAPQSVRAAEPGRVFVHLDDASDDVLDHLDLSARGGEILGIAGVSGNGQTALAEMLCGLRLPNSGRFELHGAPVAQWSPATAIASGVARIPEDRHADGMVGDMSVAENLVSEAYRASRFSRFGWMNWTAARRFADQVIAEYDVKCPGPETPARLLSGGNMQKLILGRAFDGDPDVILANQPSRGLDIGAVSYVHDKLLEARARGAAVILISEDLDEIMKLADRIQVMTRGRLTPPTARGALSVQEIGALMAGGAKHAA